MRRRTLLGVGAALTAGAAWQLQAKRLVDPLLVRNVTELYSVHVARVVQVKNSEDVRQALRQWSGRVSVGGGRYSMGGQTAVQDGWQLDMRTMCQLVRLDPVAKTVRVQAGMRWRDLQALIDPLGLSVRTMQSYANFTVGGSVSVNCHGRYVGHGAIASTVRALQMVLADGEVLEASPSRESELFYAALGGYGAMGVITEVELQLDDNFPIERHVARVAVADYPDWFAQTVAADPGALLHNADLVPPSFDKPLCVTWRRSGRPLTNTQRLHQPDASYLAEKAAIWALTELPGSEALRKAIVETRLEPDAVVWRNFEASLDVAELEPATRAFSSYVLQEYFIPEQQFRSFARGMASLLRQSPHGTLNVSIRHAPADEHTLMAWARQNVFSFVVYYKQRVTTDAAQAVGEWTRAMVALALAHGGSYYLPYQLHAEPSQFLAAYPQAQRLRALRQRIGAARFSNALWERYGV